MDIDLRFGARENDGNSTCLFTQREQLLT